ncbi:MAG: trypsin-like peptidase domain-containing protein [Solirubrobacterales bacterium]
MNTNPTQPAGPPAGPARHGSATKSSLIGAVIGGAIVAVAFAILLVTGIVGSEERVIVQQGVSNASAGGDGSVQTVNAIYKRSAPGVVSIRTRVSTGGGGEFFGQSPEGTASGTGVVVDKKGFIITNAHVVDNNQSDPTVQFSNEKTVKAKIVGRDPSNDIAVLKVDSDEVDLTPLPLGDSAKLEVGSPVVAIGSPFGLDQTVTTGIVSALQRQITAPNSFTISNVIQTDAAINPGNSGGPLLDAEGRVIGINSQIATSGSGEGSVGIGFAVPIDTVKRILPDLEKDGKVEYAYLGVTTTTLTPELTARLNFGDTDKGALVACVVKGGPADKAGLRAGSDMATIDGEETVIGGDLIVAVDGKDVDDSEDVASSVTAKKSGDSVKIKVVREGKERELEAKLGVRPTRSENNCSQPAPTTR